MPQGNYAEVIEGLQIFQKYPHSYPFITAEHDEIWAGPSFDSVTADDVERLEELGWHYNDGSWRLCV